MSSNKTNYDRHILTLKHKKALLETKKSEKVPQVFCCDKCIRPFKSRSGLWKHGKNCQGLLIEEENVVIQKPCVDADLIMKVLEENSDLRKLLCDQQKQIGELIPKVGNNNNNQFNLNVFLDEQCKDAINWDEFIRSIELGMEHLNMVMGGSITNGVAQVICRGIDELGVYKRPIHCVDTKRKKLCIKKEGIWEHDKEKNNKILESGERKLQHKHVLLIQQWQDEHPDWSQSEEETNMYINLVQKMMENIDEGKCISEISKSAMIPKNELTTASLQDK